MGDAQCGRLWNKEMAAIDLKALVGRLNEACRRALEAAAGLTLSRTHYNVEIEHWLLKLADAGDGDIAAILRHYQVDQARLTASGPAVHLVPQTVVLLALMLHELGTIQPNTVRCHRVAGAS